MVEFALLLPFLAVLVLGTVDLGRGFSQQNRLKNASREGAAYAQLKPARVDCPSPAVPGIKQRVINEDPALATQDIRVFVDGVEQTACPATAPSVPAGSLVEVRVEKDFDVLTPFIGAFTGDPIRQKASTKTVVQN